MNILDNQGEKRKIFKTKDRKTILLVLFGLLLLSLGLILIALDALNHRWFGVVDERILLEIPIEELPEDTLYITHSRRMYQRGEMTLIIPAIEVATAIGESTEPEYLKSIPGLYEFSAMPGEGDVNTSIAGHRDIYGKEFYALDRVQESDSLYLIYQGKVYRYLYRDTKIVRPNDWDVILPQGFSCLTLTTCEPIGTTLSRLVLRAELAEIQDYHEGYRFL